ncbi:MAG: hypothetical protein SFY66_05065 [Oculatellaceae cyanobacterium bins.114]|nr:hypothetical protein [Oculatellaceae cyanobacterium bins.114]
MIQILFERVKQLEADVTRLRSEFVISTDQPTEQESQSIAQSNHFIEDFLDGAGI